MNAQQLRNSILQEAIEGRLVPPACRQAGKTLTMNPQTYIKGQSCWFTYVIECEDGSFYKGFTDNLLRRYKQHCDGIGAEHTKRHKPKQLYYWEMHYSQEEALAREKYLKSGSGREWFQREVVEKADNWEPASVLLAKIRKEKEQLVKEGKLKKKDLEETPISEDEIPFDIPDSWEWVRWGALSESIQYGYNAPAKEKGRIKMVRISDIQNGEIVWETTPYCDIEEQNIDAYKLKKNDILFARTGGTVGKSYLVSEEPQEAIYAGYLIRTRYSSQLCPRYLKMFMESSLYWAQLMDGTIATAQPNCNGQKLAKMILPLPPLAEQHRIVAKIEELLPKVEEYGKAQETLDKLNEELPERLKKSILQEAIEGRLVPQDPNDEPASVLLDKIRKEKAQLVKEGKLKKKDLEETPISEDEIPFDIPKSWEWVRLGAISTYASTKKKINAAKANPNLWGLDLEDIEKGGKLLCIKSVGERKAIGDKVCFSEGDILYSKLRPYLLKILIAPKDGICTPEIIPFICYGSICKDYVVSLLKSSYVDDYINSVTFGVKMPRVSTDTMSSLVIPLPPLAEQHRIVEKLEQLLKEIDKLKA